MKDQRYNNGVSTVLLKNERGIPVGHVDYLLEFDANKVRTPRSWNSLPQSCYTACQRLSNLGTFPN